MVENLKVCLSGSSLLKELAQIKDASYLQDLAVVCTDGVVFTHRLIICLLSPTIADSLVDVCDPCLILPDNSTLQLNQLIQTIFTPQECEDKMPRDLIESLHWVDFRRARNWHIAGVTNRQLTWPSFFMNNSPSKRCHGGVTHGLDGFSEEFSQFATAAVNLNQILDEMESSQKVTRLTENQSTEVNGQPLLELKIDFNQMSPSNIDSSQTTVPKELVFLTGNESENNTTELRTETTNRKTKMMANDEINASSKRETNTIDLTGIAINKPIVKTIPMDVELENLTLPKDDTNVVSRVRNVFLSRDTRDIDQDYFISPRMAHMASLAVKDDCISPRTPVKGDCISTNTEHTDIDWTEYSSLRSDGKRQCKLCPKSFSKEDLLRNHITTSHLSKVQDLKNKTQCTTCGKILYDKHSLRKHENTVHLKIRAFSCEICCKKFAIKNDLRDHIQCVHDKVKTCICDLCGLSLATRHGLRMHRLIHQENTKNINCDKCSKSFRHMSTFKKHVSRVHEFKPENRIQCPHCDRLYNHDEGLQRHVKKFHGPVNSNKFQCNLCTATFAYNYDLNKHRKRFHRPYDLSSNSDMTEENVPASPNDVKRIPIPRLKSANSSINMDFDSNQIYIVKDISTVQNITLGESVNMEEFGMESEKMGMSMGKESSVCQRISFNPHLPLENATPKQTIQTILGQ